MNVNIVVHNNMLRIVRTIDIFTLDLGRSFLDRKKDEINIKNEFINFYNQEYQRLVHKTGYIGSIKFYTDVSLPTNKMMIFYNNKLYEIDYEDDGRSFKDYLSDTLKKIEEHNIEFNKKIERKKQEKENPTWIAEDEKNKNKEYMVNQRLERDKYAEELMKKKRKNE